MSKTCNLNIRMNPEIKEKAESILNNLGLTSSNAIDLYYRQIILNNGLPFEIKFPKKRLFDISDVSEDDLKEMLELGLQDFENGKFKSFEDAFLEIDNYGKL
ncbi:type II toxin-antitoxin system RelB/DinJ family antitoxin [Peptoniphilus sp. MSJ-1]|uniref:Type II toxin-antitoxin system RelB/DinJ family antitoxin n=1 Tax=Peptoniphilus ovalis TaxID=2841503 RepID=A0ABS6FIZ2_9FIRM|nr:type II toxin-antitoxin system RelB/DinJ family antitoxin [Peptoniphilus ovalis]MBU5670146.1 type II toxin-antitoxin system RelB/DinJ family antitoxin [Peptoniphilus ovalis]